MRPKRDHPDLAVCNKHGASSNRSTFITLLSYVMDEQKRLRSEIWFNDREEPGETAVYIERFSNYGITREEMQSARPIIGIAQTGRAIFRLAIASMSSSRHA